MLTGALAIGCPGAKNADPPRTPADAPKAKEPVIVRLSKSGLGFRLSEGDDNGADGPQKQAKTTPMSAEDTKKLFDRLPKLQGEADDVKAFALRDKSIPAPRPGNTEKEPFPPPVAAGAPPSVAAGPLKITRHEPDGEVSLAPYLTLSFSAPMVPITSHDDLSKIPVPVKLSPEPPGKWRWLGTQTVMFQPDKRFPMSTDYAVDVERGTKGVTGAVLGEAVHFKFNTPTVKLVSYGPQSDSIPLNPIIYARFDQAIDPEALLRTMVVKQDGKPIQVRFATKDEIGDDQTVSSLLERNQDDGPLSLGVGDYKRTAGGQYEGNAAKGRMIIVKPVASLNTSASIAVDFPSGTPSAEGPKTTQQSQSWGFHTYGPLRVVRHECGKCDPFSSLSFEVTNELDLSKFDKRTVKVSPEISDMKTALSGRWVTVSGRKKGRTKYKVTLGKELTDVFDQTLGQDDSATFDIGPADSALFSEEQQIAVLDPASSGPKVPVFSVNDPNLRVRLLAVKPEDYPAYLKWRQDYDYDGKMTTPPGRLISDKIIHPKPNPDELTETPIDLTAALKDGFGQVLAIVETTRPAPKPWMKQWVREWLQVTHIGMSGVADPSTYLAWETALDTGAPLGGVEVAAGRGQSAPRGTTAADGTVMIKAREGEIVIARKGSDVAFMPDGFHGYYGRTSETQYFTFDDRKMYKPGEEVHVKGWLRHVGYDKGGDVSLPRDVGKKSLHWVANDPRGAELMKGDTQLTALGGFDFVVKTPNNANLGEAQVHITVPGEDEGYHTFQIQEFRRPEFEVSASSTSGPHFVGEHGTATVEAKYYAGGGLPNAEVTWNVTRTDGAFRPPNRDEYVFGKNDDGPVRLWRRPNGKQPRTNEQWKGNTNPQGAHHMRVDFDALEPAYPMSLSLNASVMDVNRQAWAASTTMLVHPASVYVGLKFDRSFINAGESLRANVIVSDLDGGLVAKRPVTVKAARLDWEQTAAGYEEKEVDQQTCSIASSDAPVLCALPTKKGGRYRITAIVEDELGRKSQTAMSVWVMDRDMPQNRGLKEDAAELVTDKKEYAPGDTAEILVVAPFTPAEGLLVVGRSGILTTQRFTMTSRTQTLKVKVEDAQTPNMVAHVLLTGASVRDDDSGTPNPSLPKKPAYARGVTNISIPPLHRTLKVAVVPRDKAVEPGGCTTVDVDVKDARGTPIPGAEVAVVVVDESILALSGYTLPNPVTTFYPMRDAWITEDDSRSMVLLAKPSETKVRASIDTLSRERSEDNDGYADKPGGGGPRGPSRGMSAPAPAASAAPAPPMELAAKKEPSKSSKAIGGKADEEKSGGESGGSNKAIVVRTDFSALAVFQPKATTDSRGHLEVPVKLPDNLTRYRVMAVVVAHEREFGSQESTITARLPLMVRPSAPRFLNFGDKFELPVVLQNQTDKPINVALAVRSLNAMITDTPGKRVDIAPNDRVEVRFMASADKPGKARFQIGAAAGNFADASNIELPVWTPATTEAFATYGVIDNGAIAQPVKMPGHVVTQFGGLEITTSSTAMQGLTDAVLYLVHYPFECNEQISSRMLAVASLRDVLTAFKSKDMPSPKEMEASMLTDMDKLKTRQKWDGGWAFWWGEEWPYLSIHVSHALARSAAKGYKVDETVKQRSLAYLRSVENHIPHWYDLEARRAIIAYALYVRRLWKDADPGRARQLMKEYGGAAKMNLEAVGWIWPTISEDVKGSAAENAAIRKAVANRVTETAGAAHFVTSYGDGAYLLLHSDRRADGILLEAMIVDQPDSDLIPKLVKGLLNHRKAGRWGSTQENAFVLLALDKYFNKYESVTPDFVARVWLGERYAGDHTFKGRSTEYSQIDVPMQFLADLKEGNLTVSKEGAGRLYFRLGMQYAPEDLRPPPMDQGFTVNRTYETVEDDGDVKKDADGVWHFKAGKKVRARVTMVVPSRRYHVALVDPIPAGIEPMNPALAVTGTIPQDPNAQKNADPYWYWHSTWYEHQNMRDERVEAFSSLVWEGVHEYVYTARATTPGTFIVPPPKAEEMYSPEVFGRGAGDKVVVE